MSQHPSNVKNMDTTGKFGEEHSHVPSAAKRTWTIWRKIALGKLDVQTLNKTIRLTQDDVYKKRRGNLEVKYKRNVSFLEARKIAGSHMRENTYASIAWRVDPINQDNKYGALVEKLIQLS